MSSRCFEAGSSGMRSSWIAALQFQVFAAASSRQMPISERNPSSNLFRRVRTWYWEVGLPIPRSFSVL